MLDEQQRREVGDAVRRARQRRGWSLERIAGEIGLSHHTWRKVEHGLGVKVGSYAAIAYAFGVPAELVVEGRADELEIATQRQPNRPAPSTLLMEVSNTDFAAELVRRMSLLDELLAQEITATDDPAGNRTDRKHRK